MEPFKQRLLNQKTVSVWGVGYLGYTEIIKLQSKGFTATAFDFTNTGFQEKIRTGNYPDSAQTYSWSEQGNLPAIDASKLHVAGSPDVMFASNVHVIAFPVVDREGNNLLKKLGGLFLSYKKELDNALILFLSAGTPGTIVSTFIEDLRASKVACSFAAAFRSDWAIEEFLARDKKRILAADDAKALEQASLFYDLLGVQFETLSSIKEAEVCENAKNCLQFTLEVFINQLAMAYPDTDIRTMIGHLMENIELNASHLSIGSGGYKMPNAVSNLLEGSRDPNALSLIREVQNANIGMTLNYAELARKMGYTSATIAGISIKGYQRNIELSPSVILAEYLNRIGLRVLVDDPSYDAGSLAEILPFCTSTDIATDGLKSDVLFIMTDHSKFRFMTQRDIDKLGINRAALIIDNAALFMEFTFSPTTKYHAIGDGKLGLF